MVPSNFKYIKANSVDEAISLMKEHGDDARILAGGHSLIPSLKLRLADYEYLIDISKIAELKSITESDGHIHIGAGVTHGDIEHSDLMKEKISFFAEAAGHIGDVQVRNMGTIGGSIAHADPAADWPALLLAAEAVIVIQNADGTREVAAEDFFHGLFATAVEDGDMITSIKVPIPQNANTKYVKFVQPASRFALVGCAALISSSNGTCSKARVAFAGVSAKPFRDKAVEAALEGQSFNADTIASATAKAADGVSIMSDNYASENYRHNMAKVFSKRALSALL